MKTFRQMISLGVMILVIGCSSGPVLYPNQHYKTVGKEKAQREIEECDQLANQYVESKTGQKVAKGVGAGAIIGGAVGAVSGIFTGNVGTGLTQGAAIGGAAGGAAQGVREMGPSEIHQSFVNKCLSERGYEVVGWE